MCFDVRTIDGLAVGKKQQQLQTKSKSKTSKEGLHYTAKGYSNVHHEKDCNPGIFCYIKQFDTTLIAGHFGAFF